MAQINLLKNENSNSNWSAQAVLWLTRLFALAVLLLVLFYGYTAWKDRALAQEIPKIQEEISQATKEALNLKERSEFLTRQTQLKELTRLYGGHVTLSKLFSALADVTLKGAQYSSIRADSAGIISAHVSVPNIEEVDKFLQVFDSTGFNKNFSQVRVSGIGKSERNNQTIYNMSISMKYNPQLVSGAKTEK